MAARIRTKRAFSVTAAPGTRCSSSDRSASGCFSSRCFSILAFGVAVLFGFTGVAGLSGCGKKEESNVTVSLIPESPVVINADLEIPDSNPTDEIDDSEIISAPWYRFRVKVENKSDKAITIVAVVMDVKSVKDGSVVQSTHTISAGDNSGGVIAQVAAQASYETPTGVYFYASSLPEADTFKYSVSGRFEGWIGSSDAPEGRLDVRFDFRTE